MRGSTALGQRRRGGSGTVRGSRGAAPHPGIGRTALSRRYRGAGNLALVQGLLQRSEHVRVEVREHVRAVVRFAKLAGLLCTYSPTERGTALEVSSPLSILCHTTKYGFALASFLPSAVATPGFCMEARCVLGGEPGRRVHRRDGPHGAHPRAAQRRRQCGGARARARCPAPLHAPVAAARVECVGGGEPLVLPRLHAALRGGFSVLVEVLGFSPPSICAPSSTRFGRLPRTRSSPASTTRWPAPTENSPAPCSGSSVESTPQRSSRLLGGCVRSFRDHSWCFVGTTVASADRKPSAESAIAMPRNTQSGRQQHLCRARHLGLPYRGQARPIRQAPVVRPRAEDRRLTRMRAGASISPATHAA